MHSRIDRGEARPRAASRGPAFVYVLPCRHEDILKLGHSRDPFRRVQSLHRRYFEFFDLDLAFLINADSVREARSLESELAQSLALHRAPAPLVVPRSAAGHTEWYRGAYARLFATANSLGSVQGYTMHAPLSRWLGKRLEGEDRLFQWTGKLLELIRAGEGAVSISGSVLTPLERSLRDILDAYVALGVPLDSRISSAVMDWYRTCRERIPLVGCGG